MLIYRLLIALAAAVLGSSITLLLQLTVAGGIQLTPISAFIIPILPGAALGFAIGFSYHKGTAKVLRFLSRFIEW